MNATLLTILLCSAGPFDTIGPRYSMYDQLQSIHAEQDAAYSAVLKQSESVRDSLKSTRDSVRRMVSVSGPFDTISRTAVVSAPSNSNARWAADHYTGGIWTHPSTIHAHLREHGYSESELSGLSHDQKERLHSATHMGQAAPANRQQPVSPAAPSYSMIPQWKMFNNPSNCPGGRCPR